MTNISQILNTLNTSPSVELLRLRNKKCWLKFLVNTFNLQAVLSSENIHIQLADFLEDKQIRNDEDSEINPFDTYEDKAKKYFCTGQTELSYQLSDEQGEVFYELSAHSSKTIDWLTSLKKEFGGTESNLITF